MGNIAGSALGRGVLAPQALSRAVLREKYLQRGERTADDVSRRVAGALAEAERGDERARWRECFHQALRDGFIPAGRIQWAAGGGSADTLVNCFVQPLGDARAPMAAGWPPLDTALAQAMQTLGCGGGVGYDLSRLAPAGAADTAQGAGPLAALHRLSQAGEHVASSGARRSAQMGVLRCDHPDIEAFIHAKDGGGLANFNLSVGVTDGFMRALREGGRVALVHRAEPGAAARQAGARQQADGTWVWRECPARVLWDQIMRCAFDHGEPGVLFLDAIQRDDNLSWCETLEATNPCGEQPLPPYGGCCLGSIDLTRFVLRPFEPEARFDMDAFAALCAVAVRMLDDVLDVSPWPLPQQHEEAMRKRRIGLGFTGLGDALVMLNLRYDSRPAREMAARVARCLRDAAYGASVALAAERGAYPLFDAQRCLAPPAFASRLPLALKQRIRAHGLRNSHLLSIAPTGTISLAFADNASPGIEPAFAWSYLRQRRDAHGRVAEHRVEDRAWRLYRSLKGPHAALTSAFVGALAISAIAQVLMVAAVAPFIDASISKTVNLPAAALYADAQKLYHQAWLLGLKGLTIHRPNMVTGSVLSG